MCDTKVSSYSNIQSTLDQFPSSSVNEPSAPNKGLLDGKSIKQIDAPKIVQNQELLPTQKSNLQNSQVIQKNPPVGLSELVRYEALPDRQLMIEKCGRPKDDMLFGLIKMSTNYKSVLNHLDKVHDAMDRMKGWDSDSLPEQMISKFKNELAGLEKAVDQYIAGSNNQRFKTEMAFFKLDIQREKTILKEFVENQLGYGVTLNEAINYAKQGIDPPQFKLFKEVVLHPQDNNSPINYLSNDQKNTLTELAATKDTVSGLIAKAGNALKELQTNVESYRQHEGLSKGFKTLGKTIIQQEDLHKNIDKFKEAISQQETILKKLDNQAKDWPAGLSLKEAISYANYAKEGFSLAEAKILSINPKELQKIVNDESESIINQLSPDKIAASICADAQKLRADLRKNDGLSEENVAKLLSQADYAVKQYVDIFVKNGKILADFPKMTHAQLENNINQFPQADLSKEDRALATKLMDLINENTSLIHLKYQGFDQRFTIPEDMDALYKVNIEQQLKDLIPSEKIKNSKEIESIVKNHLNGLLRDRIDARIVFGAMDSKQITDVLEQWLSKITSLTPQQRSDLSNDILPKLINQYLPKKENTKDLEEIGRGATGIVYKGILKEELESGEKKVTKETPIVVKEMISRWSSISESLLQAGLNENPYIPKIVGFSENDRAAIFMEKTDGENYAKLLDKFRAENDSNKSKLSIHCITGMIKGLEWMHQRDLVHCDLKLGNMILDQKTLEPRLIDFGGSMKKGTELNSMTGTSNTISPEMASPFGHNPEPASDIYALGCIMYEQITGELASDMGKPGVDLFLDKKWSNSPMKECKSFIEACMKIKPGERPTTQQILQAVRGEPIEPAKAGEPGLTKNNLPCLDILKPENGYALAGKHLLADKFKSA
jgi:predicted transcriptional regulator